MEHTMKRHLVNKEIGLIASYLLISIAGGYVLAHTLIHSIPVNQDSYAPIQQVQTLIQGQATNLFSVHVARIPSLFPDLIILSGISLLFPLSGGLDLLTMYAWVYSILFLFFSASFVKEAIAPKKTHFLEPLSIGLIIISLLAISPTARDAYGHMLTPVHHGGNILNTIILLLLTLKLTKNPHRKVFLILFYVLVIAGVASNKLFLFTALMPSIYLLLWRNANKKIMGGITLMVAIGWSIGSSLNAQCAPEISINIATSLGVIKKYWLNYGPIIFSSLFSLASLGIIFLSRPTENKSNLILSPNLKDALAAISISCLTFYLYIFILSGGGDITIRYALMFFSSVPIFISLLIHTFTKRTNDYWLIGLIGLLGSIIHRPGYIARKINHIKRSSIPEMMRTRHLNSSRELYTTLKFIKSKELENAVGFSDYWGAGIAIESNSKLSIFPIHSSGEPDYWSMSPETLIKGMNRDHKNFYVVSKNKNFLEAIKQNIGTPLEHWEFNTKAQQYQPFKILNVHEKETTQLLIYRDKTTTKRMSKHASMFQRNCDATSPLHMVR
ncbi:hypothetical protein N9Z90_01530 [Synechococcus sp. AH-707-D15]|nr:hypothetical protein [Synechococcus sp. AH-707-D15]